MESSGVAWEVKNLSSDSTSGKRRAVHRPVRNVISCERARLRAPRFHGHLHALRLCRLPGDVDHRLVRIGKKHQRNLVGFFSAENFHHPVMQAQMLRKRWLAGFEWIRREVHTNQTLSLTGAIFHCRNRSGLYKIVDRRWSPPRRSRSLLHCPAAWNPAHPRSANSKRHHSYPATTSSPLPPCSTPRKPATNQ